MMACEMAYYWKEKGKTLIDALHMLFEEHGYYLEGLTSITLEGIEGSEKIAKIMEHMRDNSIKEIAGVQVKGIEDYLSSKRIIFENPHITEQIELPQENVMKFILDHDSWVCLRPSGTEPKIKCYYGVCGESKEASEQLLAALQETMDQVMDDIVKKS